MASAQLSDSAERKEKVDRIMKITFEKRKKLDFKTNEAYKTLRTNIRFSGEDMRVIVFTSSLPNEGKSEVSFQLAASFAEDGKRVIFVDADIRKSVTVARHGVSMETQGLSHYLSGQAELEEVIYGTDLPDFSIIFTGQTVPNPTELLGVERFQKMIERLRKDFDYVIIDCPPLGSVIDAAIVAKECDGAVIVIEAGSTSLKIVRRVKKQLEKSGCRILGAVLNKVDMSGKGYGHYSNYYGKYYGSYGDYGQPD